MVNYRDEFEAISSFQSWLSSRNFFRGAKSTVMQISFVMLLFSDQISGRGKSLQGGKTASGGRPLPPWKKARVVNNVHRSIWQKGLLLQLPFVHNS